MFDLDDLALASGKPTAGKNDHAGQAQAKGKGGAATLILTASKGLLQGIDGLLESLKVLIRPSSGTGEFVPGSMTDILAAAAKIEASSRFLLATLGDDVAAVAVPTQGKKDIEAMYSNSAMKQRKLERQRLERLGGAADAVTLNDHPEDDDGVSMADFEESADGTYAMGNTPREGFVTSVSHGVAPGAGADGADGAAAGESDTEPMYSNVDEAQSQASGGGAAKPPGPGVGTMVVGAPCPPACGHTCWWRQ